MPPIKKGGMDKSFLLDAARHKSGVTVTLKVGLRNHTKYVNLILSVTSMAVRIKNFIRPSCYHKSILNGYSA